MGWSSQIICKLNCVEIPLLPGLHHYKVEVGGRIFPYINIKNQEASISS